MSPAPQTVLAKGWTSLYSGPRPSGSVPGAGPDSALQQAHPRERPTLFVEWIRHHPGASTRDLAEVFGIGRSTATLMANALVKKQLLARRTKTEGRNCQHFYNVTGALGETPGETQCPSPPAP